MYRLINRWSKRQIDNICFYDTDRGDFNFKVGTDGDYFNRDEAPEEVVEFLDEVLNKAKYVEE